MVITLRDVAVDKGGRNRDNSRHAGCDQDECAKKKPSVNASHRFFIAFLLKFP